MAKLKTRYQFPNVDTSTIRQGYAVVDVVYGLAYIDEENKIEMDIVDKYRAMPAPEYKDIVSKKSTIEKPKLIIKKKGRK